MIQDQLDHGASKEPMNTLWENVFSSPLMHCDPFGSVILFSDHPKKTHPSFANQKKLQKGPLLNTKN